MLFDRLGSRRETVRRPAHERKNKTKQKHEEKKEEKRGKKRKKKFTTRHALGFAGELSSKIGQGEMRHAGVA